MESNSKSKSIRELPWGHGANRGVSIGCTMISCAKRSKERTVTVWFDTYHPYSDGKHAPHLVDTVWYVRMNPETKRHRYCYTEMAP
eukprot:jgi/Psemu1/307934/fgenesh1_kg.364_\